MAEVALPREHHRDAVLVGSGDDLVVPDAAARLDDGRDTGRSGGVETVTEREERIAPAHPTRGPTG